MPAPTGATSLSTNHAYALTEASGINDDVIAARGYRTIDYGHGPTSGPELLRKERIAKPVWSATKHFPGLLIPLYGPDGRRASIQYRPDKARKNDKGKYRKYEMPYGRSSVLDVHPFHRDTIVDPSAPLLITEGTKKGDALTSAARDEDYFCSVIALSGVYNWRSTHGTLPAWEEVALRGRTVYLIFDSDTATNTSVAAAMKRLGSWLKSKGAKPKYVVCPTKSPEIKVGADDFLRKRATNAKRTLSSLLDLAQAKPPVVVAERSPDATEAGKAEALADEVLSEEFRYVAEYNEWRRWTGRVWIPSSETAVTEVVRQALVDEVIEGLREKRSIGDLDKALEKRKITALTTLARGIPSVFTTLADWDEDPYLLNCPNGVVDLRTKKLLPHDPAYMCTRMTSAAYDPDAHHEDWDSAMGAFTESATRLYVQAWLGSGLIGKAPAEDKLLLFHGAGRNGKSTIIGPSVKALGGYARGQLPPALLGGRDDPKPHEVMEMKGLRLGIFEETPDGHHLNMAVVKRMIGSTFGSGSFKYKPQETFEFSHTLVVTSNFRPIVSDTDDGTWGRLVLVPFTKRYAADSEPLDLGLRQRLEDGEGGRGEAVLAWLVDGAYLYQRVRSMGKGGLVEPPQVAEATKDWRLESDLLLSFVEAECTLDPGAFTPTAELLAAFNDWALVKGHSTSRWSSRMFAERVASHGMLSRRGVHSSKKRVEGKEVRGYGGLSLTWLGGLAMIDAKTVARF